MCDDQRHAWQTTMGLERKRLCITATHTHATAPMLRGVAPNLFGNPIPDEQWQRIDRYTSELTDKLELVALNAWEDRQPARLSWGIGSVNLAVNRRTKGGPVDHDLPILIVKSLEGKLRAIYLGYACHNVTLSNNKISGDWTGHAQDLIQREYLGAIAMMSIGCGADQNPSSGVTGDKIEIARDQGALIASEVKRLVSGFLAPVTGEISARWESIDLESRQQAPTRRNGKIGLKNGRRRISRPDASWNDSIAVKNFNRKVDYPIVLDVRRLSRNGLLARRSRCRLCDSLEKGIGRSASLDHGVCQR